MPPGWPAADAAEYTGSGDSKESADDRALEAGGRAETEHTVTVAAGIWGRSPWTRLVTSSIGCPSWDGPTKSVVPTCPGEDMATQPIKTK